MTRYVVYRYLVMYTNLKKTSSRNFPTSDLARPLPPLSSDFIGFGLTPPPPKKSDVVCGCSLATPCCLVALYAMAHSPIVLCACLSIMKT